MVSSKLVAHGAPLGSRLSPLNPIGFCLGIQFKLQGILSKGSHDQSNGRDGGQKKAAHDYGGGDFPQRKTELEPQSVQRSKNRGLDEGDKQKSSRHRQRP